MKMCVYNNANFGMYLTKKLSVIVVRYQNQCALYTLIIHISVKIEIKSKSPVVIHLHQIKRKTQNVQL